MSKPTPDLEAFSFDAHIIAGTTSAQNTIAENGMRTVSEAKEQGLNPEGELFDRWIGQLDARQIPYVVLHGYEAFPKQFSSDVDYAIVESFWDDVTSVHRHLGTWGSWRRVQSLRHEATASYDVFMHRDIPGCNLKLDFCSDYVRNGAVLIRDEALVDGRRRHDGFSIPAANVEYAYVLAKGLAKRKSFASLKPVLRRLQLEDHIGCRERTKELIGEEGANQLEAFLSSEQSLFDVNRFRQHLLKTHKSGLKHKFKELVRIANRFLNPTGFSVAVLGPDGVGKSTVIDGLKQAILPAFRRIDQFHFRPNTFGPQGVDTPHTNPHGATPRFALVALAKIFYYYFDHLLGNALKVWPLKTRSSLVIFDRCFDDIIVDPRRFRIGGFKTVARVLRRLLPKHDLVIVLDAEPSNIIARKQELSLNELLRQRDVYADFAAQESNYMLIDANKKPEEVIASCYRAVVDELAKRLSE